MLTFKDLDFKKHPSFGYGFSAQAVIHFENRYGVSVITGAHAYSDDKNKFEAAVLFNNGICYNTPITDDVVGCLNEDGVTDLMRQIQELPEPKI